MQIIINKDKNKNKKVPFSIKPVSPLKYLTNKSKKSPLKNNRTIKRNIGKYNQKKVDKV